MLRVIRVKGAEAPSPRRVLMNPPNPKQEKNASAFFDLLRVIRVKGAEAPSPRRVLMNPPNPKQENVVRRKARNRRRT
jgi:hypothetical protein